MQIGLFDHIAVNEAYATDTSSDQIRCSWTTQTTYTDNEDPSFLKAKLAFISWSVPYILPSNLVRRTL